MSKRHKALQAGLRRKQVLTRTALAVLGVALVGAAAAMMLSPSPGEGKKAGAPDFQVTDSEGNVVRLSGLAGKPVVLFFMTSSDWCAPCRAETKGPLNEANETYRDSVAMLSLEMVQDRTDADLNVFKAETGAEWPHARDTQAIAQKYGVLALSTVVIVGPDQRIAWKGGDPSFETLAGVLEGFPAGSA